MLITKAVFVAILVPGSNYTRRLLKIQLKEFLLFLILKCNPESNPVKCVPPVCWPWGVCPGGCVCPGGVHPLDPDADPPGPRGRHPLPNPKADTPLWTERITDVCENSNLPQTSFTGGNQ